MANVKLAQRMRNDVGFIQFAIYDFTVYNVRFFFLNRQPVGRIVIAKCGMLNPIRLLLSVSRPGLLGSWGFDGRISLSKVPSPLLLPLGGRSLVRGDG